MSEKWIYRLDELGREHNDLVGKKCANLGEMTRAGFRVPRGFALAVRAYEMFMDGTNVANEIRQYLNRFENGPQTVDDFEKASKALREIVESKDMPKDMEASIISFYEDLCQMCNRPDVAVSVRSAGVVSRPGQYETYLNIKGKQNVVKNIIKVWSSSFVPRALAFRSKSGLPLEKDPIGVAVIGMVNAKAAGVLFTANPNTGDTNKIMIEANWGLGESVVSGVLAPDTFFLNKDSLEVLEKQKGKKTKRIVSGENGTLEEDTPSDEADCFCLTDEELKELGQVSKAAEARFGGIPLDLEWAIDKDLPFPRNVFLLQARAAVIAKKKAVTDQVLDRLFR